MGGVRVRKLQDSVGIAPEISKPAQALVAGQPFTGLIFNADSNHNCFRSVSGLP